MHCARAIGLIVLFTATADVQVFFSSSGECETVIIDAIEEADSTIDAAVYFLTDQQVSEALLAARARGVDIRIIIDTSCLRFPSCKADFLDSIIPILIDTTFGSMHHKFAVLDDSLILTGSYNWTHYADAHNDENLVVITSAELAEAYRTEFQALWEIGAEYPFPEAPMPEDYEVYVTETGKKYHRRECFCLEESCIPMMKSEAIEQGYEPCKVCDP